jgi:CheY-like chemotaxis protein
MGGKVGVETAVGRGSVFWVELPAAESPLTPLEAGGRGEPGGAQPAVGTGRTVTVLYIEDNLSNFDLVKRVLKQYPQVRLLPAMQGRLGLDLARRHRPDLILLDLHLPDIPGNEVLQRLREAPETRATPVIMITADATAGQAARLIEAGARAYLTKPLDVKQFLTLIDEFLMASEVRHGNGQ